MRSDYFPLLVNHVSKLLLNYIISKLFLFLFIYVIIIEPPKLCL